MRWIRVSVGLRRGFGQHDANRLEHRLADGSIGLMEDRPGIENRLCRSAQGLNLEQIPVSDDGLQRCDFGVGA
jgi:hypothetical protein